MSPYSPSPTRQIKRSFRRSGMSPCFERKLPPAAAQSNTGFQPDDSALDYLCPSRRSDTLGPRTGISGQPAVARVGDLKSCAIGSLLKIGPARNTGGYTQKPDAQREQGTHRNNEERSRSARVRRSPAHGTLLAHSRIGCAAGSTARSQPSPLGTFEVASTRRHTRDGPLSSVAPPGCN